MAIELIIGVILIAAAIMLFLKLIKGTAVTVLAVCVLIAGLFLIFGGIPGMPGVSNFLSEKLGVISGSAVGGGSGLEITDIDQDDQLLYVTVTNIGAEPLEEFKIYLDDEVVEWSNNPEIPLEPTKNTIFEVENTDADTILIEADDATAEAQLETF